MGSGSYGSGGEVGRKSELKKFRTGKKAHPFILGEARNTLEK